MVKVPVLIPGQLRLYRPSFSPVPESSTVALVFAELGMFSVSASNANSSFTCELSFGKSSIATGKFETPYNFATFGSIELLLRIGLDPKQATSKNPVIGHGLFSFSNHEPISLALDRRFVPPSSIHSNSSVTLGPFAG